MHTTRIGTAALAFALMAASAGVAQAASQRISLTPCANELFSVGQPVGVSAGNSGAPLSRLRFNLLDPARGNTVWLGSAGGWIDVQLSAKDANEAYLLMNTYYGQSGGANAFVTFKATGGVTQSFSLVGNTTIRDFNNWVFTNTINGTSTQTWWTNNPNPTPQDQTKRLDVHRFVLGAAFQGKTLTHIIVRSPTNAAVNILQPFVAGMIVSDTGTTGVAKCVPHAAP